MAKKLKLSGKFELLVFDLPGYHNELDKYFKQEIVAGARTFLNAATANLPVWSGASLGTFRPLAKEVNYPIVFAPRPGSFNSSPRPSTIGELVSDKGKGIYSFEYKTNLRHLVYNEFNNANVVPDATLFGKLLTPGPYGAIKTGRAAVIRQMCKRPLPSVRKHFTMKTITF